MSCIEAGTRQTDDQLLGSLGTIGSIALVILVCWAPLVLNFLLSFSSADLIQHVESASCQLVMQISLFGIGSHKDNAP